MAKRKMIERDFAKSDLPKNRKEVFFDCIKQRFPVLLLCGVMLVLFLLPLFCVRLISDIIILNSLSKGEESATLVVNAKILFGLLGVPCYAIASLGFAGVYRVLRQLVWGEGIFFKDDFADGIKKHWKTFILTFTLAGIVIFFNESLDEVMKTNVISVFPIAFSAMVLMPPALFALSASTVYDLKYLDYLKNGLIFYLKSVPTTLIFVALLLLALPIALISNVIYKYLVVVVMCIVLLPLAIISWLLYSYHIFDKFLNKQNYPSLYDRGVYRK